MKKKNEEAIIGQSVVVHPFLTTDPYNSRGKTAVVKSILHAEPYTDLHVQFQDGSYGLYEADALLILATVSMITKALHHNYHSLSPEDRSIILNVVQLLKGNSQETALILAITNELVMSCCLINCQAWMEMKRRPSKEQNRKPKM